MLRNWSRIPWEIIHGLEFPVALFVIIKHRQNVSHLVVSLHPGNDIFMGKDKQEKSPWVKPKKKRACKKDEKKK